MTKPNENQSDDKLKPSTTPKAQLPTVDELAVATGNVLEFKNPNLPPSMPNARHAAAATLHGWDQHLHHAAEPMRLSEADYLAALEAAEAPPDGSARLLPHRPALSPECGHAFQAYAKADEVEAKRRAEHAEACARAATTTKPRATRHR